MTKALPGKKGFWGNLKDAFTDAVWGTRSTRLANQAAHERNDALIENQQKMKAAEMQLQALMHDKNLEHQRNETRLSRELQEKIARLNVEIQASEGNRNRELQAELARLNRELQANEGQLNRRLQENLALLSHACTAMEGKYNRELQADLAKLGREFQANQGHLNRQHSEQLEVFRAKVQVYLLEQQKSLQIQLSERNAALQKELAEYNRETSLVVIREQRRQQNWPLTLDDEQIQDLLKSEGLLLLFSPPTLKYDRAGNRSDGIKKFPDMDYALANSLRNFLKKYSDRERTVDFMSGVWISKAFHSEGACATLFQGFRAKPTLLLNVLVEGNSYHLEYGYWNSSYEKMPGLSSIPADNRSLSWEECLIDAAKARLSQWERLRNEEQARSGSTEEYDQDWGTENVQRFLKDLELLKREQRIADRGQDPTDIPNRDYLLLRSDTEAFCNLLTVQLCLLTGKIADEHFLLNVAPQNRKPPLLPELLPDLLKDLPPESAEEVIEMVVSGCIALYQALEKEESAWVPELKIDLALSLTALDDRSWAREQLRESLKSWLHLRGLPESKNRHNALNLIAENMMYGDLVYVEKLFQCLDALGDSDQIHESPIQVVYNRLRREKELQDQEERELDLIRTKKIRGDIRHDEGGSTLYDT
jgi:hypothetical protein